MEKYVTETSSADFFLFVQWFTVVVRVVTIFCTIQNVVVAFKVLDYCVTAFRYKFLGGRNLDALRLK